MTPNDPRWISRPISFVAVIKLMNITWVTWSYHVSCRRNSDVDRKKKEEERRRRNWSNIRSCGCAGRIRRRRRNWSNIRSCGCAGRIRRRRRNWSNIRSCGCAGRIRRNWSNIRSCGCAGRIRRRTRTVCRWNDTNPARFWSIPSDPRLIFDPTTYVGSQAHAYAWVLWSSYLIETS